MKIKMPSRMESYRAVRKMLPPPSKPFATNKGRGGYDRKRDKRESRIGFE